MPSDEDVQAAQGKNHITRDRSPMIMGIWINQFGMYPPAMVKTSQNSVTAHILTVILYQTTKLNLCEVLDLNINGQLLFESTNF